MATATAATAAAKVQVQPVRVDLRSHSHSHRPPFPHMASSRQEFWPALISASFHHEKEHTKNTSKIKTPANLPLLAISAIFGVSVVNSGQFGEPKRVPGRYFSIFLFVRARVVNFARVVLFSLSKNGKVENARFLENQRFS